MKRKKQPKKRFTAAIIAAVVVVALSLVLILLAGNKATSPALTGTPTEDAVNYEIPATDLEKRVLDTDVTLPVGKLIVTRMRTEYDGTMRLVVPRLELDCVVGADTTLETLGKMPGLYKYSQMPNLYNTNVSIAAHRDLPGYEFYYLDTVTKGDFIYLIYKGKLFKYAYRDTLIVAKNDWNPIRVHYDSRVTLTTCTPLGTSKQRMIVVGELVEQLDYTDDYDFAS